MSTYNPLDHHRGPFHLKVCRPRIRPTKRQYPYTYETVKGTFAKSQVKDEADLLLGDPRDNIISVFVYSASKGYFVTCYKKGGAR